MKTSQFIVSSALTASKIAAKPLYRYLALEGGGVKGFIYLGAAKALDEAGILNGIEKIAGASAGAIGALFLSTGWPVEKMLEHFNKVDFAKLLSKQGFWQSLWDEMKRPYEIYEYFGLHDAKEFHELFQSIVEEATTIKGSAGTPDIAGKKDMTFAEWHQFKEAHPELHLKDPVIVACNLNTGLNETFAYDSQHKDVAIADAIRASMSFPLFFTPWEIKK